MGTDAPGGEILVYEAGDGGVRAESPVWDGRRLLYLDLLDPAIVELRPGAEDVRHPLPLAAPLGGLCLLRDRAPVVCCRRGIFRLDPESLKLDGLLSAPDESFEVAPPNDAAVHPSGSLVIATADASEKAPTAGIFVLSPGRPIERLLSDYTVGNGPASSHDGSIAYIADSPKGVIYSYYWNEGSRSLERRETFSPGNQQPGLPDGLTVDSDGGVWNARWGGGLVVGYAPDGREVRRIEVPARLVTSCAFGGPELRTLFVTTARAEGDDTDLGGHIFSVEVGRSGVRPLLAVI